MFSDAFTERYRRDGMVGVRVPYLNPQVWRYAIEDAAEGAMVWRDDAGEIAAFNMAHRSGVEGWMGPLAVRTEQQGEGSARRSWAPRPTGCSTGCDDLGLETMPRTVDNIGFYSRLGFTPGHLTLTMTQDIGSRGHAAPALLSQRLPAARDAATEAARTLVADLVHGPDFTREILLTAELGLGDTTLLEGPTSLDAFVVWHSTPLAEGRPKEEVRILKLAARNERAFQAVITATEAAAARAGIRRVAVRCETRHTLAFRRLVERGYRVRWTDLRMTYDGYPEQRLAEGVVFSNWEI